MKRLFAVYCCVLFVTCVSAHAQQAPFTFDVGVDVREMHPQVTDLHIRCAVYGEKQGVSIGKGEVMQKLVERRFEGTIAVPVTMQSGYRPEAAQRYACRLRLILANGAPQRPANNASTIALRPLPGADYTPLIEGRL